MKRLISCSITPRGIEAAHFTRLKKQRVVSDRRSVTFDSSPFQRLPVGAQIADAKTLGDAVGEVLQAMPEAKTALVLPDSWLRTTVFTVEDLPRRREEVRNLVAWRLKKILNAEPRDLRFTTHTLSRDSKGEARILVTFTVEKLLSFLEQTFSSLGRDIGHITSHFWAIAPQIHLQGSWGLLTLEEGLWSLGFFNGDDLLFFRQKFMPARGNGMLAQDIERTWAYFFKRWNLNVDTMFTWSDILGYGGRNEIYPLGQKLGWAMQHADLTPAAIVPPSMADGDQWEAVQSAIIGAACLYV
ncbi:MAG TPA: hypothetical protein PK014_14760 [Thermoanaerobaculia bacterium]|nr:hypothetical protein [Thermoanaerobaculia bacterium]HUM31287.1 hypothetical protein [Thermoanaerobaculia bacterium]HXK69642.1 hypothetical protein [Thermoanaerobaculia bacterium]